MRPARDFADVSEAERIPLLHSFSGRPSRVFLQAERIPLPHWFSLSAAVERAGC